MRLEKSQEERRSLTCLPKLKGHNRFGFDVSGLVFNSAKHSGIEGKELGFATLKVLVPKLLEPIASEASTSCSYLLKTCAGKDAKFGSGYSRAAKF